MDEIEYLDELPSSTDAGVVERSSGGGLKFVLVAVAGVLVVVLGLVALDRSAPEPESAEPVEETPVSIAPEAELAPGFVAVDGEVFRIDAILGADGSGDPFDLVAVDDPITGGSLWATPIPTSGGWRQRGTGLQRTADLMSWLAVSDPEGLTAIDSPSRTIFASAGDSVAGARLTEDETFSECDLPTQRARVVHTSDGGATWAVHDVVLEDPEEFTRLGRPSGSVTLAVSGSSVALKWVPEVEMLARCLVVGTDFETSDVSRTTFEGIVLSPSSGRGGELVTWSELGVDPIAAQASRRGDTGPGTLLLFEGEGEAPIRHLLDGGFLSAIDGGFVVWGLAPDGGSLVIRFVDGVATELPNTSFVVGDPLVLGTPSNAFVVDSARPGQLSLDGGVTFRDVGLPPEIAIDAVVDVDGVWYAATRWTEPSTRTVDVEHEDLSITFRSEFGEGRFGVTYGVTVLAADGSTLLERESTPAAPFAWADVGVDTVGLLSGDEVVVSVPRAEFDAAMEWLDRPLPQQLSLVSRRDQKGNWSHRPLSDLPDVGATDVVARVFDVGDSAAFVISSDAFRIFLAE